MKAYDRVEWSFLCDAMLRIGFAPAWVAIIMRCISTVTYQVRINGALSEMIVPMRDKIKGLSEAFGQVKMVHMSPISFMPMIAFYFSRILSVKCSVSGKL
ncbi:hypothetical protein V6N11_025723 [Hibiscus sabdariffa]|uniref:Reverse transcriptase n=1 Tax=Hibiscus sabdariffa TaxID=183260 RepID=A0ABR2SUE7_9ROSI